MNYKLWLIGHNVKHFIEMRWLDVKYANDETWLAILLVSTWIFCAYVASVN